MDLPSPSHSKKNDYHRMICKSKSQKQGKISFFSEDRLRIKALWLAGNDV
jgi:hypothetical protein